MFHIYYIYHYGASTTYTQNLSYSVVDSHPEVWKLFLEINMDRRIYDGIHGHWDTRPDLPGSGSSSQPLLGLIIHSDRVMA